MRQNGIWDSTWTYSHTQLSLYRLCPRRYYERYILPPPEIAIIEAVSKQQVYSSLVIHPGIEALHTNRSTPFDLELSIKEFREHEVVSGEDTSVWDLLLAESILESYSANPITPSPTHVEREGHMKIDDILTGEKNKYQWLSKPDFVNDESTIDLKFTLSHRPFPLEPYNDQMLGQAITWNKPKFQRYQICVDKKTMTLTDILVDEHFVDDLLRQNWFERTYKTMHDIERARAENLWPEHDHACGAYAKVCPFKAGCVTGRVRFPV